jgi:hypothetical protein
MGYELIFPCFLKYFPNTVSDFKVRWKNAVRVGSCTIYTFVVTRKVSIGPLEDTFTYRIHTPRFMNVSNFSRCLQIKSVTRQVFNGKGKYINFLK